jgi:uncharacterized protein DUF983
MGRIFRSSIYRGLPKMYERCPVCDLKLEREEGYFLGAMYISYGLALPTIAVLAVVVWAVTRWTLERVVIAGILLFVPLSPAVSRLSRILWIYFDRKIDPE